jgi:hypothetical protein
MKKIHTPSISSMGKAVDQCRREEGFRLRRTELGSHVLLADGLEEVFRHWRIGGEGAAVGRLGNNVTVHRCGDAADLAIVDLGEELRIGDLAAAGAHALALEQAEEGKQQEGDDNPNGETAELVHVDPQFWKRRWPTFRNPSQKLLPNIGPAQSRIQARQHRKYETKGEIVHQA